MRRRVEQDVAGVEVGVHEVVHEQHLEVEVLPARHHEARHVSRQRGAAAAAPHDLVDGIGRHELPWLKGLEEHRVTAWHPRSAREGQAQGARCGG